MRPFIEIALFVGLFSVMVGCGVLKPLHEMQPQAAQVETHQGFFAAPDKRPATVRASESPVAASVAHIVHSMEACGVVCLAVGGALIYFGRIIPGVKCVLAGIALPVSAVWFNYHYGIVIAGILLSSAVGFLWALNKKHPEYLAEVEGKFHAL